MIQTKNKLIPFAFLGFSAALLGGCVPMRTVTYPNHSYDTVFKSAVAGLCAEKKLVVYEADKKNGVIKVESKSVWGNSVLPVVVYGAGGGTPSITVRGNSDWLEKIIASKLPAGKQGISKAPGAKTLDTEPDMDIERQQLDLEKEKLKFEREKLEFEKQKLKDR
ncbi:MAG: hypothetical protein AAB359_05990 [Elusimicrobiota bacterium]